jgi:hypothetical protein
MSPGKISRLVLPAVFDLKTREVTALGEQTIAGPDSIIGFPLNGRRLYCFFTGDSQRGVEHSGALTGYLGLTDKPSVQILKFPGYRIEDMRYVRSPDGFAIQGSGASISHDGKYMALWETSSISSRSSEAVRLVVWKLGDSPHRHRVFQVDRSDPKLFRLVEYPQHTGFSADGRHVYANFASGAVARYDLE